MGQTRTLFMDIRKLDRQGDDAAIVLRLMMACNDLVLVNSILGKYKNDQSPSTEYIRRGAGLYLIRVQIAHLILPWWDSPPTEHASLSMVSIGSGLRDSAVLLPRQLPTPTTR
jgi:hypothetical protein